MEDASVAIAAVIFDLDDTLCRRTAPIDWDAVTALQVAALTPDCARLGFDHLDLTEVVRRFWVSFGAAYPNPDHYPDAPLEERRWRDGPAALRAHLAAYGVGCAEDAAVCLWEALWLVPPSAKNHHLFPDAVATVLALSAAGYRLAVATARPQSTAITARELREMGLPDVFAAIVAAGEAGYRKPHPRVFESAARQLGVRPEQAVVIGDSYEQDIVPAAGLGMIPVLKLNERIADPSWVLARHQVPSLAALLDLEIVRQGFDRDASLVGRSDPHDKPV
ncbi:MAG: HAD family hydrolase, partial [Dehalococcoidia bacterium]